MANFETCINSAVKQGEISEEQGEALKDRWNEYADTMRRSGERDVEAGARAALARELEEKGAHKRMLAAKAEENRDQLAGYLMTYRDAKGRSNVFEAAMNLIENFGYGAATRSLAHMAASKYGLATAELADMLSTFRRSNFLGRRMNRPQLENVVREVLGESTGDAPAKAMAGAASKVFERLRQEYNELGGNIGELGGGYMPQYHDQRAVLNAGRQAWKDYIRPKLDLERMRDPLTKGELTPERLDQVLDVAWEHIATGGWSDRKPQARPFGIGSTANQRQEHRFLHFKSADDWLAYNRDFGKGDPIQAIFQHIRGMTRDIAAMERFGPNPSATVEWLKQVVQSEIGKSIAGKDSLYTPTTISKFVDPATYLPHRIEAMFDYVRGRRPMTQGIASAFGDIRNILTSVQLGGTSVLAAVQDPFVDMAARHLSGIPMAQALGGIVHAFTGGKKDLAVRSGLILEDFIHIIGTEARYAGSLGGHEWSRWLGDRTLHLTGLTPLTEARKHAFGLDFFGAMADHAGKTFDEMPPPLRRTMLDYGLGEKDWNKLRAIEPFRSTPDSAGILRPTDVAQVDRRLAERYTEMVLGQTERAVPTGTARSKTTVTGGVQTGTVGGELIRSMLQYKNFGLSLMTLQWQAMMQEIGAGSASGAAIHAGALVARGAAYAGSLATVLTLAGAAAMQLQNLGAGKDIQTMDPTTPEGRRFWIAALQKGGGFGILGDFLFSDMSRFGHSITETLAGPMVGMIADVADPIIRLIQKPIEGQKTNPGRELVKFIGRYTPLLSTAPFLRTAYRRIFLDQLQYLADPEAHKYFRDQERRIHKETKGNFWWRPGETTPSRAPDLGIQ
jgi:hypothetical protein